VHPNGLGRRPEKELLALIKPFFSIPKVGFALHPMIVTGEEQFRRNKLAE
jgi:hypothetical protein